jgi:hypothetical protein
MRQRKEATIIINEEPKEEVARREQSKEGMLDGWMVWISCAQGIHDNGEREKKSWYSLPPKVRWGCTVLYSRGQGGISGTAGISGTRVAPPGLWTFRFCC